MKSAPFVSIKGAYCLLQGEGQQTIIFERGLWNMKYLGYIGTYTKGESVGIYSFILDTEAKTLAAIQPAAQLDNPTYLTISKDKRFLYAVEKKGNLGGAAAFSVNRHTGELERLNEQLDEGASPCHVSVDSVNKTMVTANYHRGTVEAYLIDETSGKLLPASSVIVHHGSGPNKERQEKAHAHYAGFTPDEKYVVAVDLGIDQVITYSNETGVLNEVNTLTVNPGSGPRHLVFHPNGKFVYILTELSSEVIVASYEPETGRLTMLQTLSALPENYKEESFGSAIHVSADGRFVYAANRGHNSIAIFQVDGSTGKLSWVDHVSTAGDWPRDFMIDPTGDFLVTSNQNSSNLVLYSRDQESGRLTLLQSNIKVPNPVCVKFL